MNTTGGGKRRPSTVSTGKKAAGGKAPAATAGAAESGRGGPRRPIAPVKVSQGRNWGLISLFVAVGLIAAGIIGYGAYAVYQNSLSWQDRAAGTTRRAA